MEDSVEPYVVGLPDEFDLTEEQARALAIDAVIAGASLRHGAFDSSSRLGQAQKQARERGDRLAELALQLLITICGISLSSDPRAPFGRAFTGTDGDKRPWHTALPADLTDRHVTALETLLGVITTPVLRGQVADVLWHRLPRRSPEHARAAVAAHLTVAEETFDPNHWVDSERYFSRAYQIAGRLGPQSPEFSKVLTTGWAFLERLDGNDPLYYSERIVTRILPTLNDEQANRLFERIRTTAEHSTAKYDFERARTYYELSIKLAQLLQRETDVATLRLARAETFVTQANVSPNETQRALFLRLARQALLDIGAARERIAEIATMLEQSQALAVSEMTPIPMEMSFGDLPNRVIKLVTRTDPIKALWALAAVPIIFRRADARRTAENVTSQFHFAYGFGRRHINRDGREQGQTAGTLGADEDDQESAIRGAMRDHAAQCRVYAVFGAIEPGRQQLVLQHEYTLEEIVDAIQHRPFIPNGHVRLWAKGIHAGLVGEYDIAAHLLAPQMEHALREVLRRRGVIVYTTQNGFQRLFSVENVLEHDLAKDVFGDDYIFTLDSVLADRLGANVRNDIAHGIASDDSTNSYEAAFLWWLALRLLRAYGPDPLAPLTPAPAPSEA